MNTPTPEEYAALQDAARKRFATLQNANGVDPRVPFHPQIRAVQRRLAQDPAQAAWDREGDVRTMHAALKAAVREGVFMPVSKFTAEVTDAVARATRGRGRIANASSVARALRDGDFETATRCFHTIKRMVTPTGTDTEVGALLAGVLRALYPCAPVTYAAPEGFVAPPAPLPPMNLQPLTDEDRKESR